MKLLTAINDFLWGPVLLTVLLGAGIYFSFVTRFAAYHPKKVWRATFGSLLAGKRHTSSGAHPFEATATALAGTIGTGNIVGVAAAITAGGPGAVFWMWIAALLGMSTKYAEVVLAVRYRRRENGRFFGGPMVYMTSGLGWRKTAVLFAVLCAACSFGIGNMVQVQAAASALESGFSIPQVVTGGLIAVAAGWVLFGGGQRILRVNTILVPCMGALYVLGALFCLWLRRAWVIPALSQILSAAFSPTAAAGGAIGYTVAQAVRFGVARGLFTNEAGMGSAPIAHAGADTDSPERQGLWGVAEVALDTLLMCTLTALVILTADPVALAGKEGFALTLAAFSQSLGSVAGGFLCVSMVFFALASLLGWALYGQTAVRYLSNRRRAVTAYTVAFLAAAMFGACTKSSFVWALSDLLNALMALPNLAAVFTLWSREGCSSGSNKN